MDSQGLARASAREAAVKALIAFLKENTFLEDYLNYWKNEAKPSTEDFRLAEKIAIGACQSALTLDHVATSLTPQKKLKLKVTEKAVLRCALYQIYMMRTPNYAAIDTMVEIAKKICHPTFIGFLNAILRKASETPFPNISDWSLKHSYPKWYVEKLIEEQGKEKVEQILTAGNLPGTTTARFRKTNEMIEAVAIDQIATDPNYYIQNSTPVELILELAKKTPPPKKILDLCASPGGKLLLAHDLFPNADLWANDVSKSRLEPLYENINKYGLNVHVTQFTGETYPLDQKFDLIILDVPCSNTGVLNKRPEARWRLDQTSINELCHLQKGILKRAVELLNPDGVIWYLTCSILKEENQDQLKDLNVVSELTILPITNRDGGYGALCSKKT